MGHTYHQLQELTKRLEKRIYSERRVRADSIRIAHHGKKQEYDRYLNSLNPENQRSASQTKTTIPTGFKVQELQ